MEYRKRPFPWRGEDWRPRMASKDIPTASVLIVWLSREVCVSLWAQAAFTFFLHIGKKDGGLAKKAPKEWMTLYREIKEGFHMRQLETPKLRSGGSSNLTLLVLVSMLLGAMGWGMLRPTQACAALPNPDLARAEMVKELKALRTSQDATTTELKSIRALLSSGITVRMATPAKPTKSTHKKPSTK
jgi:hypothetical protein